MELKCGIRKALAYFTYGSNRTFMELKLSLGPEKFKKFLNVLIVPLWN